MCHLVDNSFDGLSHSRHCYHLDFVQRLRSVLDAHGVVLTGSTTGGGAQNSVSGEDSTPVLDQQCRDSRCAPKSPTLRWYSPMKWTVATPLQLSQ